jgi:hypothetical protein
MKKDFTGKGGKRPQINIPIDLLLVDNQNPRILESNEI